MSLLFVRKDFYLERDKIRDHLGVFASRKMRDSIVLMNYKIKPERNPEDLRILTDGLAELSVELVSIENKIYCIGKNSFIAFAFCEDIPIAASTPWQLEVSGPLELKNEIAAHPDSDEYKDGWLLWYSQTAWFGKAMLRHWILHLMLDPGAVPATATELPVFGRCYVWKIILGYGMIMLAIVVAESGSLIALSAPFNIDDTAEAKKNMLDTRI